MRTKNVVVSVLVAISACGTDPAPPSCQQGLTHYYAAGCLFHDLASGAVIPRDTMISGCQSSVVGASSACQAKIDAWMVCTDGVPDPARSNADCDCSQTFMAVLGGC